MTVWELLVVYAHVVAAVFWVGQALFWTIVIGSLHAVGSSERGRLLGLMNQSPWPPAPIPAPFRVRFRDLGWAILVVLAATGVLILVLRPGADAGAMATSIDSAMAMKLAGVAVLVVFQLWWRVHPRPALAYLSMVLSLVVVALSVVAY